MKKTCYSLLSMLYLSFMMASMLLSYKFININGILTVGSIFFIPLTYTLSDLIAELYGYEAIQYTIWSTLLCLFALSILLYFIIKFSANLHYQMYTNAYDLIFHPILRIYFSNLLGILAGMFLNAYLLISWKAKLNGGFFYSRSLISSAIGELIFTSITVTLVQLGVSSTSEIIEMIALSFCIKLIFTSFSSYIAKSVKPALIRLDGGSQFVETKTYNPFSIFNILIPKLRS